MQNERSAGILLHITSLPGPFGIGDMGPEAYRFADKLAACGQRYWQLLPLNPVHEKDVSPYSAISSMAGNTLLISPELLLAAGLLTDEQVSAHKTASADKVDFEKAISIKLALLEAAYESFQQLSEHAYHAAFQRYCSKAGSWLHDYATYRVLCAHYGNKPWQEWSGALCTRNCTLTAEQQVMSDKERWWQFLFDVQWQALKAYCNRQGILMFGDLPIYVHPAAADVWAHPQLFEVDSEGHMIGAAGVPPDYFNEDGQLWNMPVYNWAKLKESKYAWWLERVKRNLEWFDVIRLDHFRAYAAYWKVAADESTARNGKWIPGPGNELFDAFKAAFPKLPFVAEDLRIIDEPVRQLRDDYDIPGMRVLQFAFGDDMASSEHIPHRLIPNTVLLTGTHDNNTTRGWFKEEAGKATRRHLRQYTGRQVSAREAPLVLSRMAYASIANTVILPMQDVLGLRGSARMNVPSQSSSNWSWRIEHGAFSRKIINRLAKWVRLYGRSAPKESIDN